MRRLSPMILMVLVLGLQAYLLLKIFPLHDLWIPEPIYNEDYGKTFYYTELGRHFLSQIHCLHGYTPDFYAGYLTHPTYHACAFLQILAFFFPAVSTEILVKLFVFLLPLLLPFFYFFAARLFGMRPIAGALAAALSVVFFWSWFSFYLYWIGSITYLWAIHLAVLTGGFLFAWFQDNRTSHAIWLCILLPSSLMLHPYSVIALSPFCLVTLLRFRNSLNIKRGLFLAFLCTVTLYLNRGWLTAFLNPAPGEIDQIIELLKSETSFGRISPSMSGAILLNPLFLLFFFFAVYGCRKLYAKDRMLGIFWAGMTALSLFINLLLILVPAFFFLLPMRFFPLLVAQLCLQAGVGLNSFPRRVGRLFADPSSSRLFAPGLLVLLFLCYGLGWKLTTQMPFLLSGPPRPFLLQMPSDIKAQGEWLARNTDKRARVLFEDDRIDTVFGVRRVLPIQNLCNGFFIGGPVNDSNSRALLIDFHAGMLGPESLENISTDEMIRFINHYNIGWVACWSESARSYFRSREEHFIHEGTVEGMDFFTVRRNPSYFLEGEGRIQATYNRIDLHEVKPEGGRVRISFHYIPGMQLQGKGQLGFFYLDEDPTPLIEIVHPGERLSICYLPK